MGSICQERWDERIPLIPVPGDHIFQHSRPLPERRSDIFFAPALAPFADDRLAHDNFILAISQSDNEERKNRNFRDLGKNKRSGGKINIASEKLRSRLRNVTGTA